MVTGGKILGQESQKHSPSSATPPQSQAELQKIMHHSFLAWYNTNRGIYVQSRGAQRGKIAWSRVSSDCNAELWDSLHSRGWEQNEDPALMSSDMQPCSQRQHQVDGEVGRRCGETAAPPPHLQQNTQRTNQRLRHITISHRCSSTFPTVCAWGQASCFIPAGHNVRICSRLRQ